MYFVVTFLVYSWADFTIWRLSYFAFIRDRFTDEVLGGEGLVDKHGDFEEQLNFRTQRLYNTTPWASTVRAIVDFLFPLVVGVWALIKLFVEARHMG
jgi:hypothetical protein